LDTLSEAEEGERVAAAETPHAIPPRPRLVGGRRTFAIVASQFNATYVQGLVNHATAELRSLVPSVVLSLHQVSGAFEIPVVARELALQKKVDAVIAMGVILKGKTAHAEHLSRSVTDALQQVAIEHGVPVINTVLSCDDEAQARERCLEDTINRGTEAARAAVTISNTMFELRSRTSG
jgi:6,7-dimethyl-8-ribityllumazine synthase